ncbi:MAG: response regulator [Bdellovibrionaceae bacterium]|nr:response regulator [Pseudobdellovibrionaceae bacterium]
MGLLIALELLTLRFAMQTLSSVRAFVSGEGIWSKAQKSATLSLHKYAQTGDIEHYQTYLSHMQVPLGDHQARVELEKAEPDIDLIHQGFRQGQIANDDIPGLVSLVRRFHEVPHLKKALGIWSDGDDALSSFSREASHLHELISSKAPPSAIQESLKRIDLHDTQLTELEVNFSQALGEGSRWLERLLLTVLFFAVITVESIGLILTISFSRNLSRDLKELRDATREVGDGDFSRRIPVRSKDEMGQLAGALNAMAEKLETNIGERVEAERASAVKTLFLANMSHEIRTPLGSMLGFAELLKDPNLPAPERAHYVDIILRTGTNLSKILNDVLDISKVEAGQMDVEKVKTSLPGLLGEVQQVMSMKCQQKGISLQFKSQGLLPDTIMTDPFRLRQILVNLIGNAIKFTEKGSITVTSTLSNHQLSFTVEDTGVGLTSEQSERLFHQFSQVDHSTRRKQEGTGLGLMLSRRLATLMGGDVSLVQSEPGKGSTFLATIHVDDFSFAIAKQASPTEATASPQSSFQGKRILIVDDTPDNRFLIERILTRRGFSVEHAENGEEGVQKALSQNFDLILMDVQMPVMDGYTAVRTLRAQNYSKPIIAVTAHAMKGDRASCLAAGYSDYLTKPIQVNEFMTVLEQHLV